jgi:hypothetical protein
MPDWIEQDIREILSNPIYTGIGPFPQIVDDETWVRAGAKVIAEIGAEAYQTQLLKSVRASFDGSEVSRPSGQSPRGPLAFGID